MRPRHSSSAGVVIAIWTCLGLCAAPLHSQSEKSAYDLLDQQQLAESLSALGMTELLEELASEPGLVGTVKGNLLRAEAKLTRATAPGVDLKDRNRSLDEASAILKEVMEQSSRGKGDEALVESFLHQIKYADVAWRIRAEPYVHRLRYLHGAASDRKMVLELTAEAPPFLVRLKEAIKRSLEDARLDKVKLVTIMAKLEEAEREVAYKSGWIRLYRAMAVDDSTEQGRREKVQLLNDAISDVADLVRGDDESGLKAPSMLLVGIVSRERGKHSDAGAYFKQISGAGTDSTLRLEALYETARNLIEQTRDEGADKGSTDAGVFDRAFGAIEHFRKISYELLSGRPEGHVRTDVTVALLRSYLYETQAGMHAADQPKAREYSAKAQEALVEFTRKYTDPDLQEDFLWMVSGQYRDRTDYENIGPLALVGLGIREYFEGRDQAKAEEFLKRALSASDEISKQIRPLALWRLGLIKDRQGNNAAAGDWFLELAEKHPSHGRAFEAAVNAAKSYTAAVQGNPNLRGRLIEALELLVAAEHFPDKRKEAARWYFDLAWEYQKISEEARGAAKSDQRDQTIGKWMSKAIAAYEKVPADDPGYMEAQHLSLELQVDLPNFAAKTRKEKLEMFARMKLLERLRDYSKQVGEAAETLEDPAERNTLRSWAAQGEFREAEILYEMGDRERVWKKLEELPKKYPDTRIRIDAVVFHIRKLIEEAQTDPPKLREAMEKAETFRAEHPVDAEQTIRLIVQRIRGRIQALRRESQKTSLKAYQVAYSRFAEYLFDPVAKQPIEQRYALTQMYAESLLEKGSVTENGSGFEQAKQYYDEALKLFEECEEHDKKNREAQIQRIEAHFDAKIKAALAASGNLMRIRQFAGEFFQTVRKRYRMDVDEYPQGRALEEALKYLNAAQTSAEQKDRLNQTVKRLEQGYNALRRMELSRVPVDAGNVHGLARTHRSLRQYGQAAKHYNRLIRGIDRTEDPVMFWSIQLEQCRCVLEGFEGDKKIMKDLAIQIRELRLTDAEGRAKIGTTRTDQVPRMGGLLGEFREIESRAWALAGPGSKSQR